MGGGALVRIVRLVRAAARLRADAPERWVGIIARLGDGARVLGTPDR